MQLSVRVKCATNYFVSRLDQYIQSWRFRIDVCFARGRDCRKEEMDVINSLNFHINRATNNLNHLNHEMHS